MAAIEIRSETLHPLEATFAFDPARESNHRIANHLSLLAGMVQVQISSLSRAPEMLAREDARSLLRETAGKIVSIGHLHRRLASQPLGDRIDVGGYLIECVQALTSSLSLEGRIGIVQRLSAHCMLSAEDAQSVGLIVSEVLMNAIKHAHPTGVPIQMSLGCDRNADGAIAIEIADDGMGLPEGFDAARDGGVGFKLIRSLAERLGAALSVESDSLGLTFRLVLPLAAQSR